ncbi:carbohydrate ABC transporter ATP-binding protein (CUT1 family) [Breoghania corrubedonensis]|uniref:Carbohydrate ABC transporter ATP-binding protein (CUT1 family) n=1 Tax=Breoghania corrubedonensis TaxID=665038 RepID=A0A2T5V7Y4_9HYPH|nr:ABC transporter ATP-binding protein [Breoghania corrubedonensis]PTW59860.1 carbohydrate ABC transporter ATP-binding protein (CUT1 family) [Breoghania corrubedonensis]
MTDTPFVQLQGISKHWGASLGVDNLDLSVPRGAFVVLLGPSGCGKSTTLRLIAGLEEADSGRILIDGRDATYASPAERSLSMVFQSYALFPHLSVAENIVFGLKVRKIARDDRDARLKRALALTGLEGYEDRKPGELSGGQRQRVALARAVVADHPLCLMDEPLSNLDAKLRHSVRQEIRALQRRLAMTVIYVTHDQTEAMTMADMVVLMKNGRIEQSGSPAALYKRPATSFAANFVGSPPMSLLPGTAVAAVTGHFPDPEAVTIGLRAESVRLAGTHDAIVHGSVRQSEFLGAETFVVLEMPGEGTLTARLAGEVDLSPGSSVGLAWDWADVHLFDRESGNRLPGLSDPAAWNKSAPSGEVASTAPGSCAAEQE